MNRKMIKTESKILREKEKEKEKYLKGFSQIEKKREESDQSLSLKQWDTERERV